MKIALSGRLFETESGLEKGIDEFIKISSEIGYEGVELRDSQIGSLSIEEIKNVRKILDKYNMGVSFISCLEKDERFFEKFKETVGKAIELKAELIRIIVEDIELIKKACRYLIENKIPVRIIEQIHTGTIFEKVEDAISVCEDVNYSNFGLSVEPGNFVLSGQDYSETSLRKLLPYMINVQFQNIKKGTGEEIIEYKGEKFVRCLPDDPEGIDFEGFIKTLAKIGYSGWVTIIEPKQKGIDSISIAKKYCEKFKKAQRK